MQVIAKLACQAVSHTFLGLATFDMVSLQPLETKINMDWRMYAARSGRCLPPGYGVTRTYVVYVADAQPAAAALHRLLWG